MIRDVMATRLKRFRENAGMTIYEVGEKIGKSGKTVSAWECGRGQPDADMLIRLCHLYGINSISNLYGDALEQKTPALESGLDELDVQLLGIIKTLSQDQKLFLLAQLQTLQANRESSK